MMSTLHSPGDPGYWSKVVRDGVLTFVVIVGMIALAFVIASRIGVS